MERKSYTKLDWMLVKEFKGDLTKAFILQRLKDLPDMKKNGKADFSILKTSNQTGMSRGKVQRALDWLIENNYIQEVDGVKWQNKKVYQLCYNGHGQNSTVEQDDTTQLQQNDTTQLRYNSTAQSVDKSINKSVDEDIVGTTVPVEKIINWLKKNKDVTPYTENNLRERVAEGATEEELTWIIKTRYSPEVFSKFKYYKVKQDYKKQLLKN